MQQQWGQAAFYLWVSTEGVGSFLTQCFVSFSVFILFYFMLFYFFLSDSSHYQNTNRVDYLHVSWKLPSPHSVFGLSGPGKPSAIHWSLLWALVGESLESSSFPRRSGHSHVPEDGCASQVWSFLGFCVLFRDVCFCEGMLTVCRCSSWTRRWTPVHSLALMVLPPGLKLLPFSLAPCSRWLFFFLPFYVPGLISR